MTRFALIDCENLTSPRHLGWAARWRDFPHIELFGRAWAVGRWRKALESLGRSATAETLMAEDAPSQAADEAIGARCAQLTAMRPDLVVLASNDGDFAPDVASLARAGITVEWARDPGSAVLALRQLVDELARDGGAVPAARIGELMWSRFGYRVNGRLRALAAQAGLTLAGNVLRSAP